MSADSKSMPTPTSVTVHQATRVLEPGFDDGAQFRIPFELLLVRSPSAGLQGDGSGQEVLQIAKRDVVIDSSQAVGRCALQPVLCDGHDTGIFSRARVRDSGLDGDDFMRCYLERMAAADAGRDATMPASQDGAGVNRP